MSNSTANTQTTNFLPVQATYEPLYPYDIITFIGPAGLPFYAPQNPNLDGVTITNSTINSTTVGLTTPAAGAFTTATAVNAPSGNFDLTNKLYVDSAIAGISWKQPVLAATTTNITLTGAQTIDTVPVTAGDRVLVKDQTNQAQNGIYIVGTPWVRSDDANTWDELVSALVFVEDGTLNGTAWYCYVMQGGVLGTTVVTWSNFSIAGTYFAGTGLTLAANTFSITNTGVSANTYGSASAVPVFAVNAQGQLTSVTNTNIAINANQITAGTIDSARISGSYTGITTVGTLSGLTVSSTINGSISGNAATATSATSATTATNLAGGNTGYLPYQSGVGATTFLSPGTNGQVLTLASGVPSWATPTTGTVTSVATAGTVNGLTLTGGPITGSGTITLGGTLDLSSPPTIGNTTANTVRGTTVTATSGFVGSNFDAAGSGGGNLRNASGTPQIQWGGGGGNNVSIDVAININPASAAVAISPTGTGTVAISPAGALTVNPTTASTMNNVAIGGTTPLAGTFTDLRFNGTLSLAGSTGTAGYVLTSNGASAPTWQVNSNGVTITDDTTTNATRYITFSELTTGTETTLDVSSTKLQFNPSSGALTATSLTPTNALGTAYGGTGLTSLGTGVATWLGTPSSANLAAAVTDETGSGSLVFATSPSLTTPNIGAATATSVNGLTITSSTGTLTVTNGKTLSASNSLTLAGTDGTTMTFPATNTTVAGLGIAQTFTQDQTIAANLTLNAQGDVRFADADSSNWVAFQGASTIASNVTWTLPAADGSNGQLLSTNGSGVLAWASNANGDVVGPASSTDNAFARFDSTTGKLLQNSTGATLDDTGIPTFTGSVIVNGTSTSSANVVLFEDTDNGTNKATLIAPASLGSDITVTLPDITSTIGFRNIPPVGTKTGSYTLATSDVGEYVQVGSGGSITIPDATFAEGDAISIFNNTSGSITITCSITTAYIAGTDTDKASVSLATRGVCTVLFISSTVCVITGNVT
jgi:hypothetical protein